MSFILKGIDEFDLAELEANFSPFLKGEDQLPHCTVRFFDRTVDLLKGALLLKRAGGHSFYLREEGVVVANATSFAFMRSNFREMDVYLPKNGKYPPRQLAFLMLQAYRYALCHFGHFQMHATVVTLNGSAVAFCGLSGAGKSTQAHLWEEHLGAQALNLDQPCILFRDGKVLASGSPWSGKEDCYRPDTAPLKAIFFVEQAAENRAEPISRAEGFALLYLNNFLVPPSRDLEQKHKKAVETVVMNVPLYRLKCDISRDAVMAAYDAVFAKEI